MNRCVFAMVLGFAVLASAGEKAAAAAPVLEIDGAGENKTIGCDDQTKRVHVGGAGHVLKITGECDLVKVDGTGHKVTVIWSKKIVVTGANNLVHWKRGAEDQKPLLEIAGLKNEAVELKEKAPPKK